MEQTKAQEPNTKSKLVNTYEERLGTDPIIPLIIRMSLPAIAAQVINLLYSIVDRIYIGHIPQEGTNALAGIGITSSIIVLIAAFSSIIGAGGAPLAAIALGVGDRKRAHYFLGNGLSLLVIMTIITSFITYTYMNELLILIGASKETLPYAKDYLSIYLLGTLAVQISTGLNPFINTQGRPAIAMKAVIIGAIMNIILDPIFIFILGLGIKGAAIATVISQTCSAFWIIRFLTSEKATLKISKQYLYPNPKIILATFTLGLSPFIMASTESLIGFVLNKNLQYYGDIHVSTLAVMQAAMLFISTPLVGFSQGFIPVVSYNYGHKNIERVKDSFKVVVTTMFCFNLLLVLIMILYPKLIASVFTDDELLINTVGQYMPLFLAGMTIFGLQRACQNMFVALGQAKISIFIALLRKVFLLIPFVFIFSRFWGVEGIYISEAVADGIAAILCTSIFYILFPKILNKIKYS